MAIKTWKILIILAVALAVLAVLGLTGLAVSHGHLHDSIGFAYAGALVIMTGMAIFDSIKTKKKNDLSSPPLTYIKKAEGISLPPLSRTTIKNVTINLTKNEKEDNSEYWSLAELLSVYRWMKQQNLAVETFGGFKFTMTENFDEFVKKNKDGKIIYGVDLADPTTESRSFRGTKELVK